ncbi:hypothetical protein WAH74_19605 [Acinetobacter baumannii]
MFAVASPNTHNRSKRKVSTVKTKLSVNALDGFSNQDGHLGLRPIAKKNGLNSIDE